MKKLLSLLLVLVMTLSLLPMSALATEAEEISEETIEEVVEDSVEETTEEMTGETSGESVDEFPVSLDGDGDLIKSGSCGDNLTWTYANGVLTISGTGEMTSLIDFWYSDRLMSRA